MKNLSITATQPENLSIWYWIFPGCILCIFISSHWWIRMVDQTVAAVDPGIWQLLVFTLICFLTLVAVSAWLLKMATRTLGFPDISRMVLRFNKLSSWHQFVFYWATFALLLLVGTVCLTAVF